MNQPYTEEELLELEKQLSCPTGAMGIELGNGMHETNIGMTLNSIKFLNLADKNAVLELGHGNCGHLGDILNSARDITYTGLEVSETMWEEARNAPLGHRGEFKLYDGVSIPFPDETFDRVFSVNCIYFWSNPQALMQEIGRVLKPDGCCVLTFVDKDFAQSLPFVRDKFTLYDQDDIARLVGQANLTLVETRKLMNHVKSKTGEMVQRTFTMAKIGK